MMLAAVPDVAHSPVEPFVMVATAELVVPAPLPAPPTPKPAPKPKRARILAIPASPEQGIQWLLDKENKSRNPAARNGQYLGFGQLSEHARKTQAAKFGYQPDTLIPNEQMDMMLGYIRDRYGSIQKAIEHHMREGWY